MLTYFCEMGYLAGNLECMGDSGKKPTICLGVSVCLPALGKDFWKKKKRL